MNNLPKDNFREIYEGMTETLTEGNESLTAYELLKIRDWLTAYSFTVSANKHKQMEPVLEKLRHIIED